MSFEATEAEVRSVREVLEKRRWREHAITLKNLALAALIVRTNRAGCVVADRRRCELILQHYAERFPFVVVGGSAGMYVATCADDLNHEKRSRLSRIRNVAKGWRVKRIKALELGYRIEDGLFTEQPQQQEFSNV